MILKPKDMPRPKVPAVIVEDDGREVCSATDAGRKEYRRRTLVMAQRQGWKCGLCGKSMREGDVTFDHETGRGMAGGKRNDALIVDDKRHNAAVHYYCNAQKGSRKVAYVVQ